MKDFERELMRRSPLAAAVLEITDFMFDEPWLQSTYEAHRGRCYEDKLQFGQFLSLMRDALVRHGGSAHQLFLELEADESEPVNESSFYRKLGNMPPLLSRALLRDGTRRLSELMPANQATLPACFDGYALIAGDGKKIKNVVARLKPTRGFSGALLGAKALVALNLRSGLAIAMSDSLDGFTNDVPLVPELLEQVRAVIPGPMLSVWDRQFDDPRTFGLLRERPGDALLVRIRKGDAIYTVESAVESVDDKGRRVLDEIGVLGPGKKKAKALRLRRITLFRTGEDEEDILLMTDLTDREKFSALDLLALYLHRWHIETVFQQITETFSLQHLIGCKPQAVLMQFAFCLLLYNLVAVVKAYVAKDGGVLASVVSTFHLFQNLKKELTAWAHYAEAPWPRLHRDACAMRLRLGELLKGQWNARYTKARDKQPRGKPKPKKRLHGDHTSVQRLLNGTATIMSK